LRADFYGRALRHRPLADALQGHVENLGPMNRKELQAAIRRPAENTKVSFEPGLVETLLDDVENKPGSLPLLQFALREMWGRQEKRKITRKSYDAIGGVEGALAQREETIFAATTENGANPQMALAFQRLFTRLVTLGEGQEDTRRVVDRGELCDDVWSLAQRLAGEENRLVVTNAPAFSRETAELVHEALIRHWPKLVDWIERDRAFQSWLRQIRSNVELWSADPCDDGPLLRGGMLAQARDWLARRRDDLSAAEQGYIEASLALQRRAEEEREAARQAEIRREQELAGAVKLAAVQRQRARIAVVGGIVAFVLAAVAIFAGYQAYTAQQRADLNAKEAQLARQALALQASREKAPGARLHVLTIGINDYADEAKKFADKDASDVANALVKTQGGVSNKMGGLYAAVLPIYLHDETATKLGIFEAFMSMQRNMEKDSAGQDVAVIMFSGQGTVIDGKFYLLPYGVDARTALGLKATGISADDFRAEVARVAQHGRVLLLLDASHSGAVSADGSQLTPNADLLRSAISMSHVTVLTSSSANESSREDEKWQNGAFTRVLNRGSWKGCRREPRRSDLDERTDRLLVGPSADADRRPSTPRNRAAFSKATCLSSARTPDKGATGAAEHRLRRGR
jgi:hypothetical protein